ncbi:uncharacterized protein [Leptinotarsa decemlineata]|uniref:uncharacterized protein n=1 Tax=Leptinotarsa decemlineata TaxID=7539 RepID=UPI003D305CD9
MMSDQKSYVPWNKSGPSIYSGSTRIKEPSTSTVKKSTDLTRSRLDSTKKSDYDRNASSKNISSTTSFGDFMQGFRQKSENSRLKPALNKKDTSHPPTSYGLLPRTGSLSRDTSPLRKSESISSASTKFSYNRLYPRTHQRSLSRENLEPVTPSVTITNYSGKKGSNWNDTTKYNSKSGILKDDVPKYTGRLSFSRDDSLSPRYKISSRTPSREDLSKTSPKYIKSRFLPKNSIEKSQTAAAKISTTKINEPSRRNKELMNALQQQEYERLSRSTSRCSSRTSDDYLLKHSGNDSVENDSKSEKKKEITMISRGTSPAHESTGKNISRPTKSVVANIIENKIPSTRKSVHTMIDKGIQPESSNTSIEVSKSIATPWSSFLDMEFSCPNSKLSDKSKVLSRTNSSNSLSNVQTSHSDSKKLVKSLSPSKSKSIPTKPLSDRKLLPPQIPKSESSSKSLHSKLTFPTNKDFRKSILNMNPDESAKTKQQSKCTDSAGSPDHEIADPDITDISENLTSCSSYHNSCGSRLPQKILNEKLRRSSSRETNITNTSGSDEDMIKRKGKRKVYSGTSPKTSSVSSADEMSSSKSIGVPHVSSIRREGNRTESDAKSFLMRALAPVTNLFKPKSYNSSDNVNWMESGTDTEATNHTEAKHNSTSKGDSNVGSCLQSGICPSESLKQEIQKVELKPISAKIILHRVEPVQNYCWTSENTKASEAESKDSSNFISATEEQSVEQPLLKHNESGEIGWWLDKKGDTPEITESSPNQEQCEKQVTKIRRNNSGNSSWWLSSSDKTNNSDHNESSGITEQKYLDNHKLKHIDSEERPWWLSSSENVSEMVQETNGSNDNKSQYVLTHQNSDEKPWWLEGVSEANINDSNFVVENEKQGYAVCHQDSGEKPWWQEEVPEENVNDDEIVDPEPIGDRASPEGLEMSEIIEGSQSGEATSYHAYSRPSHSFISRHTNIDEVLGCSTQIWSPLVKKISENEHSRSCMEKDVTHPNTPCRNFLQTSGT